MSISDFVKFIYKFMSIYDLRFCDLCIYKFMSIYAFVILIYSFCDFVKFIL